MSKEIQDLLNLGRVSAGWLEVAGITTLERLEELGSVAAYHLVKEHFPTASKNLLYALEGALRDTRWDYLPREFRDDLARRAANLP